MVGGCRRESEQPLAEEGAVREVGVAAARWAGALEVRAEAAADRRQARPRLEAADVAGEEGQLRWTVRAGVVEEGKGLADPKETLREVPPRQNGGSQQLVPVGRDDGNGHHEDTESPILHGLGYSSRPRSCSAVSRAAHGAAAGGPVQDGQRINGLGAGLREETPEARSPGVGRGGEGVHCDAPAGRSGHGPDQIPQFVADGRAADGLHVAARAEVVAGPRGTVDALGDELQARYMPR